MHTDTPPLRLLHVFPTFDHGGAQVRTADLMSELGPGFQHTVIALDGGTSARSRVAGCVHFEVAALRQSRNALVDTLALRAALSRLRPDLLLTYNWGSIDAVFAAHLGLGIPFLHAEDGFGADEAHSLKLRRVWTRRVALRRSAGVVVPSRTLEKIALQSFRLPRRKVLFIPNGVDTARFSPRRGPALKAQFGIPETAPVIGTVGYLRPEKNLGCLLEAVARLQGEEARLLIVGDGPCRAELDRQAAQFGCSARVIFTGLLTDTAPAYAAMDVFAMSSSTEQMPVALLEAMACGLPAVSTDVGDCAAMLDRHEPPFLVAPGSPAALAAALQRLVDDAPLRQAAGEANRLNCERNFSRSLMIDRYRRLYLQASGRPVPL